MKKLMTLLLAATLVLSMAACGNSGSTNTPEDSNTAQGDQLEPFDIVLDWYPNAVHTFIYVAIEKGYYAEEGLDVHVQFPANANDAITMPAAGKADAGLFYQPNIISTAVNQEIPVRILGTVVKHPLDIVMSMKDSGINAAKDLKGKTVGYSGIPSDEYFIKAMMEHNDLTYEDVNMIDVGFDLNTALISGNVDATIGGYINHEYPSLLNEGYDVTYFDITTEGIPDYEELVLITGQNQIDSESDKLARFIHASRKGFADMLGDPEGSLQILLDNQDQANYPLNADIEKASLELLLPLMADNADDFLQINTTSWQATADWLFEMGLLNKEADINTLISDISNE